MSYQEKNNIAALITTLLVLAVFYPRVAGIYAAGGFDGDAGLVALGRAGLIFIAVSIVANIAVTILFNIVMAIATGEENPKFMIDERDRMIEKRGMRVSEIATGAGFVLSMLALALGASAVQAFFLVLLSFALGQLAGNIVKMVSYRRGV